MNLRCIYCQTPFTISRSEMLGAIINMNEKHQNHYDAHCPRCRRANSISRQRMELFFPNWREAAKQRATAPVAPPPTSASASLKAESPPMKKKAETSKTTAKKAPTAKSKKPAVAASSPKGKKPAAKKTTTAKPTTKKAPAKSKKTK